jgi:hypothetical protein
MARTLKHFLNDHAARVLRNFPYPIRQRVKKFAPLPGKEGKAVVAVLCGPRQFIEGLWSLWSWMRHLHGEMGATMLFDGMVTEEQRKLFEQLFPNGRLLELEPFLAGCRQPEYLRRFVAGNWTAKKLAAVYELQREHSVLYSDCDVLVFQKPEAIVQAAVAGYACYLRDETGYMLDPWLTTRAKQLGIPISNQFNAGLVFVPAGEMKETLLEKILADWQQAFNTHHAEQTLFSMLLNPQHVQALPIDKYVLSWQGVWVLEKDLDCAGMVCRHYTGPTRHRMYLSGYPALLKQIENGD